LVELWGKLIASIKRPVKLKDAEFA